MDCNPSTQYSSESDFCQTSLVLLLISPFFETLLEINFGEVYNNAATVFGAIVQKYCRDNTYFNKYFYCTPGDELELTVHVK